MEDKTVQDECYLCSSRDTYVKDGVLNCRGCSSEFVDK